MILFDSPFHDMVADPHDIMVDPVSIKICGSSGREVLQNIKQNKFGNDVEKYKALFDFTSVRILNDA